jgi:hypothetical protein
MDCVEILSVPEILSTILRAKEGVTPEPVEAALP